MWMVGEDNLKIEGRGCSWAGGEGEERKELTIKMALYAQMGLSALSYSYFAGCILDNLLLTKPKLRGNTRGIAIPPPPLPGSGFLPEKGKQQMPPPNRPRDTQTGAKKGHFNISLLQLNYEY